LASKDSTTTESQSSIPFGTIKSDGDSGSKKPEGGSRRKRSTKKKGATKAAPKSEAKGDEPARKEAKGGGEEQATKRPAPKQDHGGQQEQGGQQERGGGDDKGEGRADWRRSSNRRGSGRRGGKRRRGGRGPKDDGGGERQQQPQQQQQQRGGGGEQRSAKQAPREASGMFVLENGGFGVLRSEERQWRSSKDDIYVPKRLIQNENLRDGAIVHGRVSRGQKHKYQLVDVQTVDGKPPGELKNLQSFKNLTSIDPDFHYSVGDVTDEVSMRIVDLLSPIGRGQRGLIVAPPRSGKTTIMRQFAHGIETAYPEVHLMVLLVDERPEEATEWVRSVKNGKVFVSTADETSKNHIQLAEAVWMRAMRLVELGEDVVLLLDSITRLARAYNNQSGGSGRTMSGGLDSRAMERPRKIFGSARNTETAGSLTIIGTTLIETGSRMDQLVFEEFKGTGNMELVLARRLADRRIFPAIDVERTGTRKEEKLVGMRRLKLIHTLRRVLARMNFVEAMELLITKLEEVEKTDDFLSRFEVDPEA
jgi:transcription termination factor Rho